MYYCGLFGIGMLLIKNFLMPYALLKAFLKRLNKIFLLHNITVVVQLHVAIKVFHFFAPHLCIIK